MGILDLHFTHLRIFVAFEYFQTCCSLFWWQFMPFQIVYGLKPLEKEKGQRCLSCANAGIASFLRHSLKTFSNKSILGGQATFSRWMLLSGVTWQAL